METIEKSPTAGELRQFLRDMHIKQRQAAKCADIDERTMRRYLAGDTVMPAYRWVYMRRNVYERKILVSRGVIKEV